MYGVIEIPQFPLQACLRAREAGEALGLEQPLALLELPEEAEARRSGRRKNGAGAGKKRQAPRDRGKSRILGLTAAAARAGVELGMTASQGQARCPALALVDRSPEAEAAARELLLAGAREMTPDYEDTEPGVTTLNLLGLRPRLRLGAAREAVERLGAAGLRARVGIAPNPDLARLACELAQGEPPVRLVEGSAEAVRAFLEPLPLQALHPGEELARVLRLWGIRTVREYLALPSAEISQRLGPAGVALWRLARGGQPRLLRLDRPPAVYAESWEFEYEIEQLDQLQYLLHLFLEKILARLVAVGRAAGCLRLRLTMRGEAWHERLFHIPEPSCDAALLFRVINTHLETLTTPEPVVAMELEATPARRGRNQPDFFEHGLRDPNRLSETLARLEALLGPGRVGRPELLDSHRPDAIGIQPFLENGARSPTPPDSDALEPVSLGPLLHRFRPPRPARVRLSSAREGTIRPAHVECCAEIRGPVRDWRGPQLVSGNWWDIREIWARQEWDVHLESGLYRLAHQPHNNVWTVEGRYG
jgi:protein ImuB